MNQHVDLYKYRKIGKKCHKFLQSHLASLNHSVNYINRIKIISLTCFFLICRGLGDLKKPH